MEKYKYIAGTILILVMIALSFFLGRSTKHCEPITNTIIRKDTVLIIKESEPIVIEKIKPKIIYKRDTMIETKPFVAVVDTVIKRDTVYAKYEFPENSFDLMIRKKPDSTMIQTIYITKEIMRERSWWETPVYIIGGVAVGFTVGSLTK